MTTESHELALCIINDGDGSFCNRSYNERLKCARKHDTPALARQWLYMATGAAKEYKNQFGAPGDHIFTAEDTLLTALEVREYYLDHVQEIDAAST